MGNSGVTSLTAPPVPAQGTFSPDPGPANPPNRRNVPVATRRHARSVTPCGPFEVRESPEGTKYPSR